MRPLQGGTGNATLCLVGRELCLYMEVDAVRVPAKQRREFVAMAVRRAAPYPDPEFGMAWLGEHAAVWYWSSAKVLELLGGQRLHRTTFVPDALYVGQPRQDAEELLALEEGFEGRLWRQGRLVANRWWTEPPAPAQWQSFLRGTGIPANADTQPPPAEPAHIGKQRWNPAAGNTRLSLSGLDDHLPRLMMGLCLAAAALFSWQAGSIIRAGMDVWRTRQAAQDLDEPLKRILAARDRADAAYAEITGLLALRQSQSQYRLLAEAGRVMRGQAWQLKHWQQPTPDRIEATLVMDAPDPEALVTRWEASPLFSDVHTELSLRQNEVVIRATVVQGAETGP